MNAEERIAKLPIWQRKPRIEPLEGGITNANYKVTHDGGRAFVRLGDDIPVHQVLRFNELAASRAAHAAGISPAVLHAEAGILVLDHIDGSTFEPPDVRRDLERVIDLVRRCHRDIPTHLRGPAMIFWVFHVVRDYAHTLQEGGSRHLDKLPAFLELASKLEKAVDKVDIVFGHNDLLAANFMNDGKRLWLIDWDYAGFNSPLFDLGGLASNNEIDPDKVAEIYFEKPVDDELRLKLAAMTAASLLRETMWSMVSEIHSTLDFDFAAYTAENSERLERAVQSFNIMTV